MPTISVTLPALFPAQQQIVDHPARFKVVVCGRRWGKTQTASWEAMRRALRGELGWWVAPTSEVARRGWNKIAPLAQRIPGAELRLALREIVFPGGGLIGFKTADSGAGLLGEGLDFLIMDEAAVTRETAWTQELRPALSDRRGDVLFISTPRGRNWFWRAYMLGIDSEQPDWASWQFPTSANPIIATDEIEAARDLLPERTFQQEYLAEFLDDGGAVFRNLGACATAQPSSEPEAGRRYIMGVDWGKSEDFTVIVVMDHSGRMVAMDRFNQIGWGIQRGRLIAMAEHWKPDAIWAETNAMGDPNVEQLLTEGLPMQGFQTTAQSKGPLIDSLALAFEKNEVSIFNDPMLMGELQAYTLERLPSGRFRYSAPEGMHDDMVIALALAWWGTQQGVFSPGAISYAQPVTIGGWSDY